MAIKITEILKRLKKAHGSIVMLEESTYTSMHGKATFVDEKFGPWISSVKMVLNGSRHPLRWKEARKGLGAIPIEEVKRRISKHHGIKVRIKEETYISVQEKAIFVDKDFGEWKAIVKDVSEGHGSPKRKGFEASKRLRLSAQTVIDKIRTIHGDTIVMIPETYIGMSNNACFIDKDHGSWWALPSNIIYGESQHKKRQQERMKLTWLKNYGVDHPSKDPLISLKSAKGQSISTLRYHWKTCEELVCQASWEPKVVDYLNKHRIDFQWQPKVFTMPNGATYRPDMFLIEENKWIEIKGWMRPHSQLKWDWFKTQFPTAELWNKQKLKQMGIL